MLRLSGLLLFHARSNEYRSSESGKFYENQFSGVAEFTLAPMQYIGD